MKVAVPETDTLVAHQRSLLFWVSVKKAPRGSWVQVMENVGLREAMEIALGANDDCVEAGIFVETASGGMLYWSSRTPDVFNSLVLRKGYS